MGNAQASPKRSLNVFVLAMMNVAVIMSLRGLPMMAKEGLSMFFYLLFAGAVFLIPTSLVSAELATGWPEGGGVYRWVKEAFGGRFGFIAIWLQWIQNVIWYPTVLAFAGGALAYLFLDPKLASSKIFTVIVILQPRNKLPGRIAVKKVCLHQIVGRASKLQYCRRGFRRFFG